MADIEIEINGRTLTAKPDQTIIQVADAAGIYIPRFCYHKHLSIPANCRMCIVEVEKSPKPMPACATPVMPGMKVFTKSQKTIAAQRAVMEFLLINHPLDCPICDQGGECELQDLSMGYGSSHSNYNECKRSIADQNLGPLIATEMTRCIACTRCVRFGEDVAGLRELGALYRGEETEISTYITHVVKSEVSGNIIDLCPVGALTSKPYRFTARAWELDQAPGISPHDCYGSNLNIHTRYGKVMRVVSRENTNINQTWVSDRDRFSYTGLYHPDRIAKPLVKIHDEWKTVEWQHAFEIIAKHLQEVINKDSADQIGALASPSSTLEEFYLLQKLMRGLGCSHIDHRLREIDTKDQHAMPAFPGFAMTIPELEQCDAIIIIGSHLHKELPLAALRIRKAAQKNAAVIVINPVDYHFNFKLSAKVIIAPQHLPEKLAEIVQAFNASTGNDEETKTILQLLSGKQTVGILLGELALHHPQASSIRYYANQLATLTNAKLNYVTDGSNSAGAWLAGAIPHRYAAGVPDDKGGLSAYQMLVQARKAYLLLNIEPNLDTANAALTIAALRQAKFIVALSSYANPILHNYAHVILPIAPFTETSGTYINATGEWQSFKGVAKPIGESRPAWKVLRVLGNFLQVDGFDYKSSEAVKHELHALVERMPELVGKSFTLDKLSPAQKNTISRIGEIPMYAIDALVRRATPLQVIQPVIQGQLNAVRLHPRTAERLQLHEGDQAYIKQQTGEVQLPVMIDDRIAMNAAWIPGGIAATDALGDLFGEVEIYR